MILPLKRAKSSMHYMITLYKNLYCLFGSTTNKQSYANSMSKILSRQPMFRKVYWNTTSYYPFSCCAIILKDEDMESILNKVIQQYSEDKTELFKKQIIPCQFLSQIDHLIKQVMESENEKEELEDFHMQDKDPELKKMAVEDIEKLTHRISSLKEEVYNSLLQYQSLSDIAEIYLEISAGVGGQEAMLFAQDLAEMYIIFCTNNGWNIHAIDCERSELGGIRHACLMVQGPNTYAMLRFEGGIHRVQRVPKTEKTGRVHTSTASVAVLPLPSEIVIHIDAKDLKLETMRASGAGGQHVNKTDSAVRITHLPSGITTTCQTSRSQEQNKKEAIRKLRAKLYEGKIDEQQSKFSFQKKLQVGTKVRSEKIRTYNFLQDRVTDHRLGLTVHNIGEMLKGGPSLQKLITELVHAGRKEQLLELLA